jgi:hypothetical protein
MNNGVCVCIVGKENAAHWQGELSLDEAVGQVGFRAMRQLPLCQVHQSMLTTFV